MPLTQRRLTAALNAGAIAIGINAAMLALADTTGLATGHDGLLRLLLGIVGEEDTTLPPPVVCMAFHGIVGLLMALAYAALLEPWLPGQPWLRGLVFGISTYALSVLLVQYESIASDVAIPVSGVAWFAAAHVTYFVVLGALFPVFYRRTQPCDSEPGWQ